MWRFLKWTGALMLFGVVLLAGLFMYGVGPANFGRLVLGVGRSYDTTPPLLPPISAATSILIFSKTNGFRDAPQIQAANRALTQIARQRGWGSVVTENAAVFNPAQLRRFKAVVWNSVSGDVLTPEQRAAFQQWLEAGGGFVGLHGSGGDPDYAWKWYVDDLIGAQFTRHTMGPQFQRATLVVEDRTHPATRHLGPTWVRTDEWYSFAASPRAKGYHILARIDERSYSPAMKFLPVGRGTDIAMGADHPMIWLHCVGDGRAFYSALGHPASAYAERAHIEMIAGAIAWAAGIEGSRCKKGKEVPHGG